jgi:hypothetical protein
MEAKIVRCKECGIEYYGMFCPECGTPANEG